MKWQKCFIYGKTVEVQYSVIVYLIFLDFFKFLFYFLNPKTSKGHRPDKLRSASECQQGGRMFLATLEEHKQKNSYDGI